VTRHRIEIRSEGGRLHVTGARSRAAGIVGAGFCALVGSLILVLGTKHGDSSESRRLFGAMGYLGAIACVAMTFQREHLILDPRANSFEHRWDGGLHPHQTRLAGVTGPIVATELRREVVSEHRLRFEDGGARVDVFVGHDRSELEWLAREVMRFLEGCRRGVAADGLEGR
jgi:hypothetical protein